MTLEKQWRPLWVARIAFASPRPRAQAGKGVFLPRRARVGGPMRTSFQALKHRERKKNQAQGLKPRWPRALLQPPTHPGNRSASATSQAHLLDLVLLGQIQGGEMEPRTLSNKQGGALQREKNLIWQISVP